MPDKPSPTEIKDGVLDYTRRQLDHTIPSHIAVVVVEGFEIVEVGIANTEFGPDFQLLRYFSFDYRCAGQSRG